MPGYQLSTNSNFRGGKLYPKRAGVRVRRLTAAGQPDLSAAGVVRAVSTPNPLGTATGRQLVPTGTGPGWLEVTDAKGKTGWVRYDLLADSAPISSIKAGDGKTLVHIYLQNEEALAKGLARTGEMLLRLKSKKGISGTALDGLLTEQKRLELRLKDRQRRVLAAKDIIKVTSLIDPWHLVFKPDAIRKWYGISSVSGVGVLPIVAVYILGGVVITGLATYGAYKIYKHFFPDAVESEVDLKKYKDIASAADRLRKDGHPEMADGLIKDTNRFGKDQADAGKAQAEKDTGPLAETGSLLKWGTIAFVAAKFLL